MTLAEWTAANQRARDERDLDPFAASRIETLAQLRAWVQGGRIDREEYRAAVREVAAW